MRVEICPVCRGTGNYEEAENTTVKTMKVCHGCGGKGWIQVNSDYYPPYPHYTPWQPPQHRWVENIPPYYPIWINIC